jgi:hypothetical protein
MNMPCAAQSTLLVAEMMLAHSTHRSSITRLSALRERHFLHSSPESQKWTQQYVVVLYGFTTGHMYFKHQLFEVGGIIGIFEGQGNAATLPSVACVRIKGPSKAGHSSLSCHMFDVCRQIESSLAVSGKKCCCCSTVDGRMFHRQ